MAQLMHRLITQVQQMQGVIDQIYEWAVEAEQGRLAMDAQRIREFIDEARENWLRKEQQ